MWNEKHFNPPTRLKTKEIINLETLLPNSQGQ